MSQIQCPNCQKNIPDTSQYCSYCGYKTIPEKIQIAPQRIIERNLPQCPNCKKDVAYTSEKCSYCGYKLIPQNPPEESRLIVCPNCRRDIVRTSTKCAYCGFRLKQITYIEQKDKGKSSFDEFQEGCAGCNKGLFQFGCAMTLLMALLGLLLLALGIL